MPPRMDCGPPEKRMNCWSTFVTPGAPKMHDDSSVYPVTKEVSKDWGPQIGIACAFKWDLRAKVDDSRGRLLPIQGIILIFMGK